MHGRESPSVCFVMSAARCLYDEDHACSRDTNTRGRTLTVSNSQIPNPLPNPPGGARGAFTALSQFSGAAQGIPYQGGAQPMPAPQAWGQPGPYAAAPRPKRPPLATRVLPLVERRFQTFKRGVFCLCLLAAGFQQLHHLYHPLFHGFEIGKAQLRLNDVDVAQRINCALHVGDVRALEAADDVRHGIHLTDVLEELVAQPLAL